MSCRRVSKSIFGRVSRQTVTNVVFNHVPDCLNIDFSLCQSRGVTDIYLEADEDHTKLQNGYSKAVNLVYVHIVSTNLTNFTPTKPLLRLLVKTILYAQN